MSHNTTNKFAMSNPFERKFRAFSAQLSKTNATDHADVVGSKSAEVYADKPFTVEYATLYRVALVGQTLSQIITFCTTAGLGIFALEHIIPLWWGVFVAVPLGIAFAFGVEKVKRSTLSIASKHLLKYKSFGFVGIVAALTLLVSIGAALYGAKELPGVVYPVPKRGVDAGNVAAINADIDRVQADIDRLQAGLKSGKNWTAENRTLPRLQRERAALVERRDAASTAAEGRADADHAEALADRAAKVERMQVYSVGAAVVAELAFLLCTAFVLYYLFRHFAERQAAAAAEEHADGKQDKAATVPAGGFVFYQNGNTAAPKNGAPMNETPRRPIGFFQHNENRYENGSADKRTCEHCGNAYTYRHHKQRYCKEDCRVAAWELRTGQTLKKQRSNA